MKDRKVFLCSLYNNAFYILVYIKKDELEKGFFGSKGHSDQPVNAEPRLAMAHVQIHAVKIYQMLCL